MSGSLLGFGAFLALIGGAIYLMWSPTRRASHIDHNSVDNSSLGGANHYPSDSSGHGGTDGGGGSHG